MGARRRYRLEHLRDPRLPLVAGHLLDCRSADRLLSPLPAADLTIAVIGDLLSYNMSALRKAPAPAGATGRSS